MAYIRIPKGEKILYIESVTATEEEFEVLISPGTKINHLKNNSKLYSEWTM